MEFFTLEALPAQHGDCLLLHYGTPEKPGLVVIDGGPSKTWRTSLEPRLKAVRAARGGGFKIDLLMVSHIDDDHIVGVVDFTGAWLTARSDGEPWPYPVAQLWHNSFERISDSDLTQVTASVMASTGGTGNVESLDFDEEDRIDAKEAQAACKVLASVAKGARLRNDAKALNIPTNIGFDGLVRPGGATVPYPLGPELKLHIAGPLSAQLDALRTQFARQLPVGEATLAAYLDESVPNLSSIVAVASYRGKRILLTGDARGDYLLDGLAAEGLLDADGRIHVDVLKLQHHGSVRNTEDDFYRRVTADHYVVSADGRFGNPDRETFELLIEARDKADDYVIHLTYPVASIDSARKKEWEEGRLRKAEKAKTKPKTKVPVPWDDATFSIAALLEAKTAEGYKFRVTEPAAGKGPKIDLLDALPY